ncbi:PKD domain-containing protein [Pseudochryseolinea flava]|nr:PKD domain-containing protein [Pseudochryseolinea flava]
MAHVLRKTVTPLIILLLPLVFMACFKEEEIPVTTDFTYRIANERAIIPAKIAIDNKTSGADFYTWTFEGATPSSSNKKQPGEISYSSPGTYTIKLEAWNDTQRSVKEIQIVLDAEATLDFATEILVNDFAPATVVITNNEVAPVYEWIFEGGTPATSSAANPPEVVYNTPGTYEIILRVSDGDGAFTTDTRTIEVKPALAPAFQFVPTLLDEDYEAPVSGNLQNQTISGITYQWQSSGGTIGNKNAEHTTLQFAAAGTYTVTLTASNGKETKSVQQQIVIKPNTNLFVYNDVKFGVSSAHETLGSFFSPSLKAILKKADVNGDNGTTIDLVFFGINSSFNYCRFISPDSTTKFTLPEIPQASHTYFVNTQESTTLNFTVSNFDAMKNDTPIKSLAIKQNDTGTKFFSMSSTPRVVLFQTNDGRKGAIKIKNFVNEGTQSYIIADVKIQKLP